MGYAITQAGKVPSSSLGNRYKCPGCGTAWYDLGRENAKCPGPSASVSCEQGTLAKLEPEPETLPDEPEESGVSLGSFLRSEKSEDDHFDNPEDSDDSEDEDFEITEEVEYIDIEDDD